MRKNGCDTRICVVLTALTAVLIGSVPAPASAQESPPVPMLRWMPCTGPGQSGFDCATAQVPLDYANPAGRSIELSVIRHASTDPARRVGTLFFNPGGPGGAGTTDLPDWISLFSPTMQSRFDIISWDPRGIGASTAVQCFANQGDEAQFFEGVPQEAFPVGLAEKVAWLQRFAAFDRVCLQRNGALLSHTSTADTAKDLDLLRQATGERTLNYLGVSYGTFLGAVYANLFADHVRAMILDGNLTPSAYTNNGDPDVGLSTELRAGSDQGLSESLGAFLDLCGTVGPAKCTFSTGDVKGTRAKFDALLRKLKVGPVTVNGISFTYALLLKSLEGKFFTTLKEPGASSGWEGAGKLLALVDDAAATGGASLPVGTETAGSRTSLPPNVEQSYMSNWQSLTVECGESPNPRPPAWFLVLDRFAQALYGPIGVVDLWGDEPCASWPVKAADQYVGPWDHPTPNTILLIGNTHDPSTPYENTVGMARALAKTRVLTVDGYGHTVLLNPSRCAQGFEDDYLVDLSLPAEGTVCEQDRQPFE